MSWYDRQRMLFDLAACELSYRQIGAKYGKTENNVKQLAWYYRAEIAKRRARLYAELRLACSGEKQYRVGVLKQIISEIDERITEIAEAAKSSGP